MPCIVSNCFKLTVKLTVSNKETCVFFGYIVLLHADFSERECGRSDSRAKTEKIVSPGVACIPARKNEAQHYIAITNLD